VRNKVNNLDKIVNEMCEIDGVKIEILDKTFVGSPNNGLL